MCKSIVNDLRHGNLLDIQETQTTSASKSFKNFEKAGLALTSDLDVQINQVLKHSSLKAVIALDETVTQGNFLLIFICNFHILSLLQLIYICKLHWNWSRKL